MKRGIAVIVAVLAVAAVSGAGRAQAPPPAQCNAFGPLKAEAQKKAAVVRDAVQKKADRKEICAAFQHFYVAEGAVVKFLEDNNTWCGIPAQAIQMAKANHEQTLKYRTAACAEAPAQPRPPSLSDAINTPSVDTGSNTKTGRGTLDSLNGNPLAR